MPEKSFLIKALEKKSKQELLDILEELWDKMDEVEQVKLLQRYSGDNREAAKEYLSSFSEGTVAEVKRFVHDCRNGCYMGPGFDFYDDEDRWDRSLDYYFELAEKHYELEDYSTARDMLYELLQLVYTASSEYHLFPTDSPEENISVDLYDATDNYFDCLSQTLSPEEYVNQGFPVAVNLVDYGADGAFLKNYPGSVKKLEEELREILSERVSADFNFKYSLCKDMLLQILKDKGDSRAYTQICKQEALKGDGSAYRSLLEQFYDSGQWDELLEWSERGLNQDNIEGFRWDFFMEKKAEALLQLGREGESLKIYWELFTEKKSWDYLMKIKKIVKDGQWPEVREKTITLLEDKEKSKDPYSRGASKIMVALRLENGELDWAMEEVNRCRHDGDLEKVKLVNKCMLMLAGIEAGNFKEIYEYMARIKQESTTSSKLAAQIELTNSFSQNDLLLKVTDVLKKIIDIHISAKNRDRYRVAAYYCVLLKEVYCYLQQPAKFQEYYTDLKNKYHRYRALKEELQKKLG